MDSGLLLLLRDTTAGGQGAGSIPRAVEALGFVTEGKCLHAPDPVAVTPCAPVFPHVSLLKRVKKNSINHWTEYRPRRKAKQIRRRIDEGTQVSRRHHQAVPLVSSDFSMHRCYGRDG